MVAIKNYYQEFAQDTFLDYLQSSRFPDIVFTDKHNNLSYSLLIELFDSQITSRIIDLSARVLRRLNLGFYTIASCGHEGNVVFGKLLTREDVLFLHYRSGAIFVQRTKTYESIDPIKDLLLSIACAKDDPIASGRHKVFGSKPMLIPPQTSTIASHLPKALGTAFSIQKAKDLHINSHLSEHGIVFCNFGDASVNHSTAQSAFNTAQWIAKKRYPLPILFVCEDNGLGISVATPRDWIEERFNTHKYLPYLKADGLNLLDVYHVSKQAIERVRSEKIPIFLHMTCRRLYGHAGSDIEQTYRTPEEIISDYQFDPLLISAKILLELGIMSLEEIKRYYLNKREYILNIAEQLLPAKQLQTKAQIMESICPTIKIKSKGTPDITQRKAVFNSDFIYLKEKRTLADLLNYTLVDLLLQYENLIILGEDVGRKGGVYNITSGLIKRFSGKRVMDTLLDETSILGLSLGLSHNGLLPMPEIQFLAYIHNAIDQLRGEAATLSFFSNGQFQNPMVIRIPAFAYQEGMGGHFHNENAIGFLRELPGVIVCAPSNGLDASKMLRTCVKLAYEQGKIVVWLEPIALYFKKDLVQANDGGWLHVYPEPHETIDLGQIGTVGQGKICILSYANGFYLARKVQETLMKQDVSIKVIDIRWLNPLPMDSIIQELKEVKSLIIVDECRPKGGITEAIISELYYKKKYLDTHVIQASESFITTGPNAALLLPSFEEIMHAVRKCI